MAEVMDFARAERADLAALLEKLTPEQWEAQSLCERWRVRDVVAHVLSHEELGPAGLGRRFARGFFTINRTNAVGVAEYGQRSPEQLLALAHQSQPRVD